MPQSFSPIQNHIISKLKNAERLRYSEVQPADIPNDLFNYHLQFLVKKGYVARDDYGYALAEAGIKHVADPDVATEEEKIASTFKVNVVTIVSRVRDGKIEILNQIRKSHPSFGKVGIMGGIVRKGEAMGAAAKRKLKVETGFVADFRVVGMERRMMYVSGKLFSDVVFPIAYADSFSGELAVDTEFGHNMWVSIDEAIENELGDFDTIRKIPDVLRSIKSGKIASLPFFYDEDVQKGQ
jgi:ADP-ribose pyrophosphatase YjhB (NUDIX family)